MTKQEQMKAIRETCNDCRDYLGLQIDKTQNDNDDDDEDTEKPLRLIMKPPKTIKSKQAKQCETEVTSFQPPACQQAPLSLQEIEQSQMIQPNSSPFIPSFAWYQQHQQIPQPQYAHNTQLQPLNSFSQIFHPTQQIGTSEQFDTSDNATMDGCPQ